jgi:hypothetical protein
MVNHRGWFKVFEATVACLLLLGVFLFVFKGNIVEVDIDGEVTSMLEHALFNIDFNESIRNAILSNDDALVEEYFSNHVSPFFEYSFLICNLGEECGLDKIDGEVFVVSRVVSSNTTSYSPKQINLQVWEP